MIHDLWNYHDVMFFREKVSISSEKLPYQAFEAISLHALSKFPADRHAKPCDSNVVSIEHNDEALAGVLPASGLDLQKLGPF